MGTFVVQIEGRSISSLLYEITDGNQDDAFLINPSTGIVTVSRGGLDYEANKNYNLSIQAMNMVISFVAISQFVDDVIAAVCCVMDHYAN